MTTSNKETIMLDVIVRDSKTNAYGRPKINFELDTATRLPIGFHISFED